MLNEGFTENQANWYGPDSASNTDVLWEPAFDNASESSVNPGPLKGNVVGSTTTTGVGSVTYDIEEWLVTKQNLNFGSTVNVGLWCTNGAATFEDDDNSGSTGNEPEYYVTYEIPTPSSPKISIKPNPDGLTGIITIDEDTDSEDLQLYSICWSTGDSTPDHNDTVTDFTDTGKKTFDTSTLTGSPLATQDTSYYFRLFAEDSANTNDNGGASNVIHVRRPDVKASGTEASSTNVAIGEEFTLTVISEDVTEAEYVGKFSSVLVNWDAGAGNTPADYDEYFFDKSVAPATTTVSNLTISHRYHKAGTFAVRIKVRDPNGWISDQHTPSVANITVAVSNPVGYINASKGKVMSAKFADMNNMLTISGAQSRAIGSDKEIENYLFTCQTGKDSTIVTMGAFDNDNEVFDTGSKRVALLVLGTGISLDAFRIKLYGLASFDADGDPIKDNAAAFAYYSYTSEELKARVSGGEGTVFIEGTTAGAADTTGHFTYNYFKSVEAAIVTTVDAQDVSGDRYLLTAYAGDFVEDSAGSDITTRKSGVLLAEALDTSELMIDVDNVEPFRVGDVIKIDVEYMKVLNRDSANNRLYVNRGEVGHGVTYGYMRTTRATHNDDAPISILDPWIINRDIRYMSKTDVTNYEQRYRWGGYAQLAGVNIDFLAHDGTGAGVGNTIGLDSVREPGYGSGPFTGSSVGDGSTDLCWYRNGFFEDDIIKVTGTSDTDGFFKLAGFTSTGVAPNLRDEAYVYGTDVDDSIDSSITTDPDEGCIIRRIQGPHRTVGIYNPTLDDEVIFELIINDDAGYSSSRVTTTVNVAQPNILDMLTATDYDSATSENSLTSADIAILSINKSRSGGLSASMPLGGRKYPVSVTRNRIGLPTLSVRLRVTSSAGLRKIRSLIESDTYDYVFIDSNQVDSPGTVDVTYRMKLTNGNLNKAPEMGDDYTADLNFVIVGEDVS